MNSIKKCKDELQLERMITSLGGQLTGSVFGLESELEKYNLPIEAIKRKVGRVIYNGVPTGVEVCAPMQHGGPYPASSDSRFTSVGTEAIKRFVRPVSYQSWPNELLPLELKDENPLNILRLIDNQWTKN